MLEREPEPLFGHQRLTDRVLNHIQAIVNRALSKDPAHRYENAAEMGTDLEEVRDGLRNSRQPGKVTSATFVSELPEIIARARSESYHRQLMLVAGAAFLVLFFAG